MKIAVLGYAGSGKTYLTDYISETKNIPALHLDSIKFDKEWKPIDDSVVLPQVAEFMEKEELQVDIWKSGELFTYYHDWLLHKNEETIFDCNSSGVSHKHCMNILIAEKII